MTRVYLWVNILPVRLVRWRQGDRWDLLVVEDHRGRSQARDFLDALARDNHQESQKLERLLARLADRGPYPDPERYKHLYANVWEVKTHKVRILVCPAAPAGLVLLEAFVKRRDKLETAVTQRVDEIVSQMVSLVLKYLGRNGDGN